MSRPRQLSLFGVEARPPDAADLEGLLAGPGEVTRMGGTARVSIVVEEAWRGAALVSECLARGLAARCQTSTVEGQWGVRTAYAAALAPLGIRWLRGAAKCPPEGFGLDGRRLRLWAIAAGRLDGSQAYTLRLGVDDEPMWEIVGAALAAVGLPAALLATHTDGPAYRIVGRRRLARLGELIGDSPRQAPAGAWP